MKLIDLYNQYSSGKLEKHKYIKMMHEKHQVLFDYFDYIKKTDIQSIVIDNNSIYAIVKGNNIKLLLDRFDRLSAPFVMLNYRSVDTKERNILFKIASASPIIFDIGANVGWYSLNFAALPEVKKVYAFEPIPYVYDYLKKHLKINNASKVSAFNFAFSDTAGKKTFYWTKNETVGASMANIINDRHKISKIKCRTTTIDKFMKNQRQGIDLIKCDVEGAELLVFKGALKTLKKYKPVVFAELLRKWSAKFNYHPNDVIDFLNGFDYGCYIIKNNKIKKFSRVNENTTETNYLFLHKTKHKNIINKLTNAR